MGRRQVHLGRAGVDQSGLLVAEESVAEQVADPRARRPAPPGLPPRLVPGEQAEHDVIMPPGVPGRPSLLADVGRLAGQPVPAGKRAEVAVGVLERDELLHEPCELTLQLRIAGESEHLRWRR